MANQPSLTAARLILVRELASGPKRFSQLRLAFFGEARAKEKATTSFYNKLVKSLNEGLIVKSAPGVYELGVFGHLVLAQAKDQGIDLASVKSEAQLRYEA